MNFELKDKFNTTKDLLNELETKSWQEIEHLQAQLANLADSPVNSKLRQLLTSLLTSYYVFAGGIETLVSEPAESVAIHTETDKVSHITKDTFDSVNDSTVTIDTTDDFFNSNTDIDEEAPFEYFVDFDEPTGEPLTDKDLYNV